MLLSGVCLEIQDIDPFQDKSSFFSLISTQSSPKGFETRPFPSTFRQEICEWSSIPSCKYGFA